MRLSQAVAAIAEATGHSHGRVDHVARRLQDTGNLPISPGGPLPAVIDHEHVALILLALLVNGPGYRATETAVEIAGYTHQATTARRYIANLLRSIPGGFGAGAVTDHSRLAFKSSITVHAGDQSAVVVRYSCPDAPLEQAFTRDGEPYRPEESKAVVASLTLPGMLLHRLGRALAELRE